MRPLCVAIALSCGCGFAGSSSDRPPEPDGAVEDDRFPTGHRYRKAIDLTPANLADPIEDFVAGVQIAADPDLAAAARADGSDLLVTAADGTPLASEIEHFDPVTGQLAIWIRLPLLTGQPTRLYLHYGDEAPAESVGPVWPDNHVAVFHGTLAGDTTPDSSISALIATASGGPAATEVSGILGAGLGFASDTGRYEIANPTPLRFGEQSFTYSVWVRVTASEGVADMPWYHGGSANDDPGYDIELGTNSWRASVSAGGEAVPASFGMEGDFLGAWTQLTVVVDRGIDELRVYADGLEVGSADLLPMEQVMPEELPRIGGLASSPFVGRLDELRVIRGVISDNAIRAGYANLVDEGFYQFGAQETPASL